jgi:hypothetical protein
MSSTYITEVDGPEIEIPDAPFYVLANDTFFSNWPGLPFSKNVAVVPCETEKEWDETYNYMLTRPELCYVRQVVHRPRNKPDTSYSLVEGWRRPKPATDQG